VRNSQVDEDGKPVHLELTSRAAKRLGQIMTKENNPDLALRVQVESGGCHGFQYLMSLVTLPAGTAPNEDDVIFQFAPDDAIPPQPTLESGVPKMILDTASLDLLKGSKVDFVMELIGSEFKITDNPLATSSCGCGTSFDIKM
jgi:iron-sulfur cluster assembly accessory protein